jgi:hypothetical protein
MFCLYKSKTFHLLAVVIGALMSASLVPGSSFAQGSPFLDGLEFPANGFNGLPPGLAKQLEGTSEDDAGEDDTDEDDEENGEGNALGKTAVLGGLRVEGYESFLRFANFGNTSGAARIAVLNGVTGEELTVWESAPLPSNGALEVAFADILGGTIVPVDAAGIAVPLTAAITGGFKGHVQHLAWAAGPGVLSNITACARLETPGDELGYVAGPGRSDVAGMIRVVNAGTQPGAVTLILRDAATGETLGILVSPNIAGMGAWEGSVSNMAAESMPPVAEDTSALTVELESSSDHFELSYLETTALGTFTDLTSGCEIKGGGAPEGNDDDGEEGDADEEEDTDEEGDGDEEEGNIGEDDSNDDDIDGDDGDADEIDSIEDDVNEDEINEDGETDQN